MVVLQQGECSQYTFSFSDWNCIIFLLFFEGHVFLFPCVGVDLTSLQQIRTQRAAVMLSDLKQLLAAGGSVNEKNDDGVTLVSIFICNWYK